MRRFLFSHWFWFLCGWYYVVMPGYESDVLATGPIDTLRVFSGSVHGANADQCSDVSRMRNLMVFVETAGNADGSAENVRVLSDTSVVVRPSMHHRFRSIRVPAMYFSVQIRNKLATRRVLRGFLTSA